MAQKGQKHEGMSCGEVFAVCGFQGNTLPHDIPSCFCHICAIPAPYYFCIIFLFFSSYSNNNET